MANTIVCQDASKIENLGISLYTRIEPIPCGGRQWFDDDSSAIIEIARREGEVVEV